MDVIARIDAAVGAEDAPGVVLLDEATSSCDSKTDRLVQEAIAKHCEGSTVITITASASGDDFLVSVGQSTTASYTAGDYRWQAYITRNSDSERLTIDSGTFEVVANR